MGIDKDLIHRLTLEELAQVISDEDQAYLNQIVRENPDAFNIWMETREVLNTPDVQEFLTRPRSIENVFLRFNERKRSILRVFSLSLSALLLVGSGFYLVSSAFHASADIKTVYPDGAILKKPNKASFYITRTTSLKVSASGDTTYTK